MSLAVDWLENATEIRGHSGEEYLIECPWCGRPKMYANPERGAFVCFRCREAGPFKKLIAKVEGIGSEEASRLIEAGKRPGDLDLLDELRGLEFRDHGEQGCVNQPLPDEFVPCFGPKGWQVPEYVDERGFEDEDLIRHGVGFALEGSFRDRVILPISHGDHKTFLARLMGSPSDFSWVDKKTGRKVMPPKYRTPRNANLSDIIYGASWVKPGTDLVAVEGCFDSMRLTGNGFSSVALFGKRITKRQARHIQALEPRSLTVLFDGDAVSYAYLDALRLVSSVPTYVAELPDDTDPDSLGLRGGRKALARVLDQRRKAGSALDSLEAALRKLG